ncbi:MAG: hypothetical protein ACYCZL_09055 [Polaromonas sp.]
MATIEEVFQRVEDTMLTARQGYADLTGLDKARRYTGLRNLIVFGRSVTFVLQNLRSVVDQNKFDSWYELKQNELKVDTVMRYFVTLRNDLEKQGRLPVSTSAQIHYFSSDMINNFPKPRGAKSFFVGDQLGGSGWEVELADGSTEKFYVEIPASVAEVTQHFHELPVPEDDELRKKSIDELSNYFLSRLEALLDDAREVFMNQKTESVAGKRLPPYMRVVK